MICSYDFTDMKIISIKDIPGPLKTHLITIQCPRCGHEKELVIDNTEVQENLHAETINPQS